MFISVRLSKSLPSKQGNGSWLKMQVSPFSTFLTPEPEVLFLTRFFCAFPEILQHSDTSYMPTLTLKPDCGRMEQTEGKLTTASQQNLFFPI